MSVIITVTRELEITPCPRPRFGSSRKGGLSSRLSIQDINRALGFSSNMPKSGDGKVTKEWSFKAGDTECGIWDYKGHRWSFSGPREVFQALFPGNVED